MTAPAPETIEREKEKRERLPYPPPFMGLATLAEHIDASERSIENWVKTGQFPAPKMQGGKRLWRWKDVERHLAADADAAPTTADSIREATRNALQSRKNQQR